MRRAELIFSVNLFILASLLFLSGCSPSSWRQADRAYKQGNMVRAIEFSVQTLRHKHGYEKAVNLLKAILEPTYENLYIEAERAGNRGDWDMAYQRYRTIERISSMISTLPEQPDPQGGMIKFRSVDVSDEVDYATHEAAEMHYRNGLDLERQKRNREAARAFTMAMSYVPNFRDASERYIINREAGMIRIAVLPFENMTGHPIFGALGDIIADHTVMATLSEGQNLEFLEMITREQLRRSLAEHGLVQPMYFSEHSLSEVGSKIGVHSFVVGRILSVAVNYPPETIEVIREEAEISKGRDEPKETVHATVTVITRRAQGHIMTNYQIIDVERGSIVRTANLPHDVEILIEFATYRGDERALSSRSRRLVNRPHEYPPHENDLIIHLTELVSQNLSREIIRFFN